MAGSPSLESLIRVTDRQGLFKGDLHFVQRASLQWLMDGEITETIEVERMRLESFALASHPATNTDYLKSLFALRNKEEVPPEPEEQEWTTPETAEDIQAFLEEFSSS